MLCKQSDPNQPERIDLFEVYAQTADQSVREELILRHVNLVAGLVRKISCNPQLREDLLQVGYIALIKAVDRYDPARGVGFQAYAIPTILGEMRHYLRDKGNILRLPRQLQEQQYAIRRESDRLTQALGREPSAEELAEALGMPAEEIIEASAYALLNNVVSLEHEIETRGDDGHPLVLEFGQIDRDIERVETRYDLERAMTDLTARERAIMQLHFFAGWPQARIGERLRLSQVQISRLQRDALQRLRAGIQIRREQGRIEVEEL